MITSILPILIRVYIRAIPKRSAKIPKITPIVKSRPTIKTFSRGRLFILKSIRTPTPAPANNPDIIAPADITPEIASCVSATEDAQFGISPTAAHRMWLITGTENTEDERAS